MFLAFSCLRASKFGLLSHFNLLSLSEISFKPGSLTGDVAQTLPFVKESFVPLQNHHSSAEDLLWGWGPQTAWSSTDVSSTSPGCQG